MATTTPPDRVSTSRQRVPAAERRDALIEAAVHEFAHGGLHGTPVDRIARRVGVAQPYVFSLFASKRELFLAAVQRCFERTEQLFSDAAAKFDPATATAENTIWSAMGDAYIDLLQSDRDYLMLQLQSYAACDDEVVRERVRGHYARLVAHVQELSDGPLEEVDEFFRFGMWLNVAAAMGVGNISAACDWICAAQAGASEQAPASGREDG